MSCKHLCALGRNHNFFQQPTRIYAVWPHLNPVSLFTPLLSLASGSLPTTGPLHLPTPLPEGADASCWDPSLPSQVTVPHISFSEWLSLTFPSKGNHLPPIHACHQLNIFCFLHLLKIGALSSHSLKYFQYFIPGTWQAFNASGMKWETNEKVKEGVKEEIQKWQITSCLSLKSGPRVTDHKFWVCHLTGRLGTPKQAGNSRY